VWKQSPGVAVTNVTTAAVESARPGERRFDVVFVLPHMGRGGAQRVISLVASAWSRQGKRICILTWDGNRTVAHEIAPGVAHFDLKELCLAIDRQSGLWVRLWRRIADIMRDVEHWLRPRWPWRWTIRTSVVGNKNGLPEIKRQPTMSSLAQFLRRELVAALTLESSRTPGRFRRLKRFSNDGLLSSLLGRRARMFRKAFSELDAPVVMSLLTGTNLYVLAATRNMNCRVVVSERNDPDLQQIAPEWQALRPPLYREADAVTSNSAGVLEKLSSFVPMEKLKLLPNPVVVPEISEEGVRREQRFVTVARLVHQKGIDLLLGAFARIAHEVPGWTLHIAGDGPLRPDLTAQAERLGIADRVTFYGHVKNPIALLQSCRIFVLPSRFEGMPNALLEAMACGLAPIVTDASPGPLECVRPDQTGLVVESENVSAIAAAMLRLARDDELTDRFARQAAAYVKEHDWEVVEQQWLTVLGMAAGKEGNGATRTIQPTCEPAV
jgi:glycosyltransferase involved in cell wall biosynthesis